MWGDFLIYDSFGPPFGPQTKKLRQSLDYHSCFPVTNTNYPCKAPRSLHIDKNGFSLQKHFTKNRQSRSSDSYRTEKSTHCACLLSFPMTGFRRRPQRSDTYSDSVPQGIHTPFPFHRHSPYGPADTLCVYSCIVVYHIKYKKTRDKTNKFYILFQTFCFRKNCQGSVFCYSIKLFCY